MRNNPLTGWQVECRFSSKREPCRTLSEHICCPQERHDCVWSIIFSITFKSVNGDFLLSKTLDFWGKAQVFEVRLPCLFFCIFSRLCQSAAPADSFPTCGDELRGPAIDCKGENAPEPLGRLAIKRISLAGKSSNR